MGRLWWQALRLREYSDDRGPPHSNCQDHGSAYRMGVPELYDV